MKIFVSYAILGDNGYLKFGAMVQEKPITGIESIEDIRTFALLKESQITNQAKDIMVLSWQKFDQVD